MPSYIRIKTLEAGAGGASRLNPFPGRYLSETEFDLIQAYVDDRIKPLVAGLPAGIISGLEVRTQNSGSNTLFYIQPGVAVGAGARLLRLFNAITHLSWPDLAELTNRFSGHALDAPIADGLYLLTLRDVVEEVDTSRNVQPCTRTEADPTREQRLETVILPCLRLVTSNPRWLGMPQARAANRVCVRFTKESPHDANIGDIPLALVKVSNNSPAWIDTVAGRFLSEPDAASRTLLAHTIARLEQWMAQSAKPSDAIPTKLPLATLLGIDYLPAAGPLPPTLLQHAASKNPQLAFNPADLQIELAPVPASTINDVLDNELARGTVDLVHGLGERIRLLLAIPDLDYRPDLMDLPQRDTALEDEMFRREQAAVTAWSDWWQQWQLLFGGMTEQQCRVNKVPQYPFGLLAQEKSRPRDADKYRDALAAATPNDEPYASHLLDEHPAPAGYERVKNPDAPAERLWMQREQTRDNIKKLEQELDESYRLLNEMNDYLNLQRQHLDSLTVSFSTLAGGVAGDGSGNTMMRWSNEAAFDPTVLTAAQTTSKKSG